MNEKIHIGRLIQKKMKEHGQKEKWLADKMQCSTSKISRICQCQSINTNILIPICIYLEYNFFEDYAEYINKHIEKGSSIVLLYRFITNEIHIGKLIHKIKKEKGIKSSWLAPKIPYNLHDIHRIYDRKHINANTLVNICICLKSNIFELYVDYVNEQIKRKNA